MNLRVTGNVRRWERAVQDAEDNLETARQAELHQIAEKEHDEEQMNKLLATRTSKKMEVEQEDEEIGKARREVGAIAKEAQALQKQLNVIESKIEQRKADRHAILMQCKMEDIAIPMLRGNMEDIAQESTIASDTTGDSTINTQQQYERESLITIDYGFLPDNLKDIDEDDYKKASDKLNKVINDLQNTIQRIQAPNMKVFTYLCLIYNTLVSVEYREIHFLC